VLSVSEFCDETLIVKVLKKIVCDSGNWKERKKSEDINETCNASEEIDLLYMQLFIYLLFIYIIYFWVSFQ
jgi:hypothetical protein